MHDSQPMDHQSLPLPLPPKSATSAPPLLRRFLTLDAAISLHLHTLTKPFFLRPLLRLLELLADFRFFFPVSLSLFLAAPPSSPLRSHLILCSLLDLLFIAFIKFIVRRSRPSYAKHDAYNTVVSVDNFSFPRGHSSRVCFVASIFSLSKPWIVDAVADLNHPRLAMTIHRWIGGDEVLAVTVLIGVVWTWALTTEFSLFSLIVAIVRTWNTPKDE